MNEQTETVEQTANPPVAMNDIPMSASVSPRLHKCSDLSAVGRWNLWLWRVCRFESQVVQGLYLMSMPSAGSKRVSRTLQRKRNLPRRPDGPTPPERPINRLSTLFCPSARTVT